MPPLTRPSPLAALLLGAPGAAVVVWGCLVASGGLAPGAASLIAAGAALPAAVVLALAGLGRWPLARPGAWPLLAAGGMAVFAAVAALSATWSLSAQASVETAVLAAGLTGAFALGVALAPALRRPGTAGAAGLAALATAASGAALVARSFDATTGMQFTPRLAGTIAIPNMLAGLALAGVFGGIALAAHRDARLRALGGATAGLNALALVLTSSRSGLGLGVAGAIALVLLLPAAPRLRVTGLVALAPGAALGLLAATWPAFTAAAKSVSPAGWGLVAAGLAAIALGALIAAGLPRAIPGAAPGDAPARASARAAGGVGIAVAVAAVGVVIALGGPAGALDRASAGFAGSVQQTGVRIGLGANQRDHWWRTAWDGFAARPLAGWGAGTFRLLEQTTRTPASTTGSAHDTVLEALAGTGLLGGLPFIAAAVGLVGTAVSGIRRPRAGDAAGAVVVAVTATAFLAQGLVDVNWNAAAIGVAVLAALGAIAPAGARPADRGLWRAGAGAVAVGLAAAGLVAVTLWLGARDATRSAEALQRDPVEALALAASAHRYAPLAVEPLLAEADAYDALGQRTPAEAALREAIGLEPDNYEPLLAYGTFLAYSWGRPADGRAALERALRLSGGDASIRSMLDAVPPASQTP